MCKRVWKQTKTLQQRAMINMDSRPLAALNWGKYSWMQFAFEWPKPLTAWRRNQFLLAGPLPGAPNMPLSDTASNQSADRIWLFFFATLFTIWSYVGLGSFRIKHPKLEKPNQTTSSKNWYERLASVEREGKHTCHEAARVVLRIIIMYDVVGIAGIARCSRIRLLVDPSTRHEMQ